MLSVETIIGNFLNDSVLITVEKMDYRSEINNIALDVVSEGKIGKVKFEKSFEYDADSDEYLYSVDFMAIIREIERRLQTSVSKTVVNEFFVEFRTLLERGLGKVLVNKLYNKGLDVVDWGTKVNPNGKVEIGIVISID